MQIFEAICMKIENKTNKIAFNTGSNLLDIILKKITNPIRKLIQQNIYLLKPFKLNIFKQNAENVPTDNFKIKTLRGSLNRLPDFFSYGHIY